MPKYNETLTSTGYFEINGKQHQKGAYDTDANPDSETLGIYRLSHNGAKTYLVDPVIYSEWTNNSDTPYASYAALISDINASFFLTKSSPGGGGAVDSVFGRTGNVIATSGDYDGLYIPESSINVIVTDESDFIFISGRKLDPSYLYIISGNVAITDTIDPNFAVITGTHRGIDSITNAEDSSSIFSGFGNIQCSNVTLSATGTGSVIFDVKGDTGFEFVSMRDCTFTGSTNLGVIEDQYAAQLLNLSITGNSEGLVLTNVGRIQVEGCDFSISNTSTTELTIEGDIVLLNMRGGGFGVDTGKTGLSVAGITSVSLYASVEGGVAFTGDGTLVDDETVFEDSKWSVDAFGLSSVYKDIVAEGNLYLETPITTVISGANTPTKVLGGTTTADIFRFDDGVLNNRLRYKGTLTVRREIVASVTFDTAGGFFGDEVSFYIYKNGVQLPESQQSGQVPASGSRANVCVVCTTEFETDDYVEVWAENNDNGNNVSVEHMNLTVK